MSIVDALQAASEIRDYFFWIGAPRMTAFVDNRITTPLPDRIALFQGDTINTVIQAIQVGDDLSLPRAWVEEWIDD